MTQPNHLGIDFETASLADLRKTGVHTYAEHPTTMVLCLAWAFNDEPVQVWRPGQVFPQRVVDHVLASGEVRGWNVGFEYAIWNKVLSKQIPGLPSLTLTQVNDTMARAAYWGLPLSLDQAGPAAGVSAQKDKTGHALMMRMCKPRAFAPDNSPVWWHETDPQKYDALCDYCAQDVRVERAVANAIPQLPADEQHVWVLDQIMNIAGVGVDYELVEKLRDLALIAAKNVNRDISNLTQGAVPSVTSTAKLLEWLKLKGYPYDNLRKETVAQRLDESDVGDIERLALELRADGAKTSAAKLAAMLNACPARNQVGLVRGMLQYYGASRTGRWAGRLIQLQNLPRPSLKQKSIAAAISCVLNGADVDTIELLFGPAMGVVTSLLRSCIVAEPDQELVSADLAQIEARVVAWLAGQLDILAVFAQGADVYTYTANKIGSKDRQLGKGLVLGCGFGMSWPKFRDTVGKTGLVLSDDEARAAVTGWRNANNKTVEFWWACDRAARAAIQTGQVQNVGPVKFGMFNGHMLVGLPSGRNLVYRDAKLVPSADRPGQMDISYMGVNQYTRKWERIRTYGGKLVENITQAVARDVLREVIVWAAANGYDPRLTVHDELLLTTKKGDGAQVLKDLLARMHVAPPWASGLPVAAEGWFGHRYRK